MHEETPPLPDGPPNPFASGRFLAAAATVGVLVVMGLVVTIIMLIEGSSPDSSSSPSSEQSQEGAVGEQEYPDDPATSAVPRSDGSESVCGLAGAEATDFTAWPQDTTWQTVGTLEAPSSTVHGPGQTEDNGYRHCYAKSPSGAVMAATNFTAMGTDPLITPDLAEHMLAEGEGRQAVLEELESGGAGSDTRTPGHIGGAKLVSYTGERARVEIALVIEEPQAIAAHSVDLRWADGDWKVVTRDDGQMIIPQVIIYSLDGYVLGPEEEDG
ncbi:hypothetical protein GCM10027570_05360 [Streptomonospora sediminis]